MGVIELHGDSLGIVHSRVFDTRDRAITGSKVPKD